MNSSRIRVLVVDDDPWSQQVISSQLAQAGFRVDSAGDGWEAMIVAGHGRPDLVIAEVHLPTMTGWSLAETMRREAGIAKVPFVFTFDPSPGMKPGKSYDPSTDRLLPKPFTIVDLMGAVDLALSERLATEDHNFGGSTKIIVEVPSGAHTVDAFGAKSLPQPSESWTMDGLEPGLRGSLACFGLPSLLMVMELERMSGILTLQGPKGSGRVALRQGRVIRARVDGEGKPRAAHAIYEMIPWESGSFQFDAGNVPGDDQIERSTSFLLVEGARLIDELALAKKKP